MDEDNANNPSGKFSLPNSSLDQQIKKAVQEDVTERKSMLNVASVSASNNIDHPKTSLKKPPPQAAPTHETTITTVTTPRKRKRTTNITTPRCKLHYLIQSIQNETKRRRQQHRPHHPHSCFNDKYRHTVTDDNISGTATSLSSIWINAHSILPLLPYGEEDDLVKALLELHMEDERNSNSSTNEGGYEDDTEQVEDVNALSMMSIFHRLCQKPPPEKIDEKEEKVKSNNQQWWSNTFRFVLRLLLISNVYVCHNDDDDGDDNSDERSDESTKNSKRKRKQNMSHHCSQKSTNKGSNKEEEIRRRKTTAAIVSMNEAFNSVLDGVYADLHKLILRHCNTTSNKVEKTKNDTNDPEAGYNSNQSSCDQDENDDNCTGNNFEPYLSSDRMLRHWLKTKVDTTANDTGGKRKINTTVGMARYKVHSDLHEIFDRKINNHVVVSVDDDNDGKKESKTAQRSSLYITKDNANKLFAVVQSIDRLVGISLSRKDSECNDANDCDALGTASSLSLLQNTLLAEGLGDDNGRNDDGEKDGEVRMKAVVYDSSAAPCSHKQTSTQSQNYLSLTRRFNSKQQQLCFNPIDICRSYRHCNNQTKRKELIEAENDDETFSKEKYRNPQYILENESTHDKGGSDMGAFYSPATASSSDITHRNKLPKLLRFDDQNNNNTKHDEKCNKSDDALITSDAQLTALIYAASAQGRYLIRKSIMRILKSDEEDATKHFEEKDGNERDANESQHAANGGKDKTKGSFLDSTDEGKQYLSHILRSLLFDHPKSFDGYGESMFATITSEGVDCTKDVDYQKELKDAIDKEGVETIWRIGSALLASFLIHHRVPGYQEGMTQLEPSPIPSYLGLLSSDDTLDLDAKTEDMYSFPLLPDPSSNNFSAGARNKVNGGAPGDHINIHGSKLSWNNKSFPSLASAWRNGRQHESITRYGGIHLSELGLEICIHDFLAGTIALDNINIHRYKRRSTSPLPPLPSLFRGYGPLYDSSANNTANIPDVKSLALDLFDLTLRFAADPPPPQTNCDAPELGILRVVSKFAPWLPVEPIIHRYQDFLRISLRLIVPTHATNSSDAESTLMDIFGVKEGNSERLQWCRRVAVFLTSESIEVWVHMIIQSTTFLHILHKLRNDASFENVKNNSAKGYGANIWELVFSHDFCVSVMLPLAHSCAILSHIPEGGDALHDRRHATTLLMLVLSIVEATECAGVSMCLQQCNKNVFCTASSTSKKQISSSLKPCLHLGWLVYLISDYCPRLSTDASHHEWRQGPMPLYEWYNANRRLKGLYDRLWGDQKSGEKISIRCSIPFRHRCYSYMAFCHRSGVFVRSVRQSVGASEFDDDILVYEKRKFAPEGLCNVTTILLPSFSDYTTSIISFALSSSLSSRMASPWCKYVAKTIFERYHDTVSQTKYGEKIMSSYHGLIVAWIRCLLRTLLVYHQNHCVGLESSNQAKASDIIKFTPLLKNLHCHIFAQSHQPQGYKHNRQHSYTKKATTKTNKYASFANILVSLIQECKGKCDESSSSIKAGKQDHLICLREILRHTTADDLFVQNEHICFNQPTSSVQEVGHLAEIMLQAVGTESKEIAANIFVGMGIYVHYFYNFNTSYQCVEASEEPKEKGDNSASLASSLSNVTRKFFASSDLVWLTGTNSDLLSSTLKSRQKWEHFVHLVQSELNFYTAHHGKQWWNEITENLYFSSTCDQPCQPMTIPQLSDGLCNSITQIWNAPDASIQTEKTKSFYRARKKSLQKAVKASLFSVYSSGPMRSESTSNISLRQTENSYIGDILGNLS